MMTQEENDLLTQTDRGTPMGELMRRYWQPVALSEELPEGARRYLSRSWAKSWFCTAMSRGSLDYWGFTVRIGERT